MKVLMISLDRSLLNPESAAAERIVKYGSLVEELHLIVFAKKGKYPEKLSENVFIYPTNSFSPLLYVLDGFRLGGKIMKKNNIDLISTQDPLETSLVGLGLKKKYKAALQIQIHGNFFGSAYWRNQGLLFNWRLKIAKLTLPQADGVRVVSKQIAESLNQFKISPEKIFYLPLRTDYENLLLKSKPVELEERYYGYFKILWSGRISKEKNLPLLLSAFKEVNRRFLKTLLVIVGSGPESEKIKKSVKELGLDKNVLFYPWQANIFNFYKAADLYVLTSLTEGYNCSVVEAMACGLPVIMTNVGLAGELVENNYNGIVLSDFSPKELTENIVKLMTQKEIRQRLIDQALESVKKLPGEREYLQNYLESWERILKT